MVEAGLIDAEVIEAASPGRLKPKAFFIKDIRPAGHDFIAALKNDGFWAKLKREAAVRGAPLTLDLLVLVAKEVGKRVFFTGESSPGHDHAH